jgi:hypothetical protein
MQRQSTETAPEPGESVDRHIGRIDTASTLCQCLPTTNQETGNMTDFVDHGTTLEGAVKVVVRKDEWVASHPWHADVHFPDGQVWRGWQSFFRTRKGLVKNARAALDTAGMKDARIVFE